MHNQSILHFRGKKVRIELEISYIKGTLFTQECRGNAGKNVGYIAIYKVDSGAEN
jgi:hypothetical protein